MKRPSRLVLGTQRHLKWPALDGLEALTMVICGICLVGFSASVFFDVLTRSIGRPWLWLQEVTSTFFVYGIFLSAITETMHGATRVLVETFNRCVVLAVAFCMTYFGYINFLQGFGNFRMPSMTPLASYYAVIPLAGALIMLFTVEQLWNGWRNGFESTKPEPEHILTYE